MFGAVYIEIEDLLHQFTDPNVMDIKMGTRYAPYDSEWDLNIAAGHITVLLPVQSASFRTIA